MGDALATIDVGTGRTVTAMSAGRYHTCAILDDGSLKCWGVGFLSGVPYGADNRFIGDQPGEMGDALPPLDLGPGRTARLVSSGHDASCAILDDGTARCWAEGIDGHDVRPFPVALTSPSPVRSLAPGGPGVLVLFDDGTVQNLVASDGAPPVIPAGARAASIAGALSRRCAVLTGGTLYCGSTPPIPDASVFGPTPPAGPRHAAVAVTEIGNGVCGLLDDGSVRCQGGFGAQPCTPSWCDDRALADDHTLGVQLGGRAVALGTGGFLYTCALVEGGAVRCWGEDVVGMPPSAALGASFDATLADGRIQALGAFHDVDLGTAR
jgi:hypothetical protein